MKSVEELAEIFAAAMPPHQMRHPKKTRFQPADKRLVAECPSEDSYVAICDGVDSENNPAIQLLFVSAPIEKEDGIRMKSGFVLSREAASTLKVLLDQI